LTDTFAVAAFTGALDEDETLNVDPEVPVPPEALAVVPVPEAVVPVPVVPEVADTCEVEPVAEVEVEVEPEPEVVVGVQPSPSVSQGVTPDAATCCTNGSFVENVSNEISLPASLEVAAVPDVPAAGVVAAVGVPDVAGAVGVAAAAGGGVDGIDEPPPEMIFSIAGPWITPTITSRTAPTIRIFFCLAELAWAAVFRALTSRSPRQEPRSWSSSLPASTTACWKA
jgi:hypothetical protein